MNDLHFYFTTARARYCFYYFIVNANKQKNGTHSTILETKAKICQTKRCRNRL